MNITEVEFLVREGAYALANHLEAYWPAEWDADSDTGYEAREANLVLHTGHAFRQAGLLAYAEVPHGREGGAATRFDLVATRLADNTWIVAEVKRAYGNSKSLAAIAADFERIVTKWTKIDMIEDAGRVFGVILATTWDDELAAWWNKESDGTSKFDKMWTNEVATQTESKKTRWGSVAFSSSHSESRYSRHHFLYAIFPLQ